MSTTGTPGRSSTRAEPRAWSRARGLFRWVAFGGLTLFVAVVVQALRHPARLWSPGVMGRVLASGIQRAGSIE